MGAEESSNLGRSVNYSTTKRYSRIALVGDPMLFSDQVVRVIVSEFVAIEVKRHDTIEDVKDFMNGGGAAHELLIVEDGLSDDLIHRPGVYLAAAGSSHLVLAYREPCSAQRLFSALRQGHAIPQIGFLPMNVHLDVWMSALRLLMSGENYVPAELLAGAAEDPVHVPANEPSTNEVGLTKRENQVLELVARGKRNKTIAHELGLSEHTVKLHIHHIISKIGVLNRTAAATWYLSHPEGERPRP